MSARAAPMDWRWLRAHCALQALTGELWARYIPFAYYAELFDLDEDEVRQLFFDVAVAMKINIMLESNPTFH